MNNGTFGKKREEKESMPVVPVVEKKEELEREVEVAAFG